MKYTCPMHPEVTQDKPGRCPKCHMELSLEDEVGLTTQSKNESYTPLIIVVSLIVAVTAVLTISDISSGLYALSKTISYFMTGFFLVFSGFKLLDLAGFANGYATYDLLAQRWEGYGYIYPFIELFFGLGMILFPTSRELLIVELIVMAFSGIGVALKLIKHEKFQCSCLGTFLKVPLTKVTLVEDFGMALLALLLLTLVH
jgi:hypothetical protein